MGLTVGADPFGPSRTGRFDFPAPAEVVYTRPLGRRVRGVVAGCVMIDAAVVAVEPGDGPEVERVRAVAPGGAEVRFEAFSGEHQVGAVVEVTVRQA